jgi:hypothetical protein
MEGGDGEEDDRREAVVVTVNAVQTGQLVNTIAKKPVAGG